MPVNSDELDVHLRKIILEDVRKILKFGFSQVVSDGYAFKIFLFLPLFLNRLHNDPEHAAANGLILSTLNLLFIPAVAPLFGISPEVSGWFGELRATQDESKKEALRNKIRATFQNGCLYALLVGTPVVTLPLIFSEKIFITLNQEEEVSKISSDFLIRYANMIAPGFFSFFAGQFFIASGKTNILLAGSLILGSSLLLSAGLGFGLGGLPQYDENGVLIAYSLESWLTATLYSAALFFHSDYREFHFFKSLFKSLKGNGERFLQFLKSGSVPMLTIISEFALMFALTAMSISFGVTSQAAFSKALYCLSLNTVFNINFAVAGLCILARTNGEMKDETELKRHRLFHIGASSIIIGLLVALPLPTVFAFYPEKIMSLFSRQDNSEVIKQIYAIASFVSIESVLKAPNYQMLFQTRPLTGGMFAGVVFSIAMILGLLVASMLAFAMNMKTEGLAAGFATAMIFSNAFLLPIWNTDMWNTIKKKPGDSWMACRQLISAGTFRLKKMFEGEQHCYVTEARATANA